jgi:hypothetical protein
MFDTLQSLAIHAQHWYYHFKTKSNEVNSLKWNFNMGNYWYEYHLIW